MPLASLSSPLGLHTPARLSVCQARVTTIWVACAWCEDIWGHWQTAVKGSGPECLRQHGLPPLWLTGHELLGHKKPGRCIVYFPLSLFSMQVRPLRAGFLPVCKEIFSSWAQGKSKSPFIGNGRLVWFWGTGRAKQDIPSPEETRTRFCGLCAEPSVVSALLAHLCLCQMKWDIRADRL